MNIRFTVLLFCGLIYSSLSAQTDVAALITKYQADDRGPYRDIMWFCADGSKISPREGQCTDISEDNYQHARYKREVIQLGKDEHLFLGQILTNTRQTDFWDEANDHSRMKQYMLGNYLAAIDDGWVNRKAQYYRGAFQVEDEMKWGRAYLNWIMRKEKALEENFYLIRQAVRDVPHRKNDDLTQKIRNDSKAIADKYSKFMSLRIKIHGQPEGADAGAVDKFFEEHKTELEKRELAGLVRTLSADIRKAYVDRDLVADIAAAINKTIPEKNGLKEKIKTFTVQQAMDLNNIKANTEDRLTAAADLMWTIQHCPRTPDLQYRLRLGTHRRSRIDGKNLLPGRSRRRRRLR